MIIQIRNSWPGVLGIVLCCFLAVIFTACDSSNDDDDNNDTATPTPVPTTAPSPTPSGDMTELEGTWVGTELSGAPGNWTYVFTSQNIMVTEPDTSVWYSGTFELDINANPKECDIKILDGTSTYAGYVGRTGLGIYQLNGTTLTLAMNPFGHPFAPAGFTPGSATRVWDLAKQ